MNWRWLIYDYIPPGLDMPKWKRREIRKAVRAARRDVRRTSGWPLSVLFIICFLLLIQAVKYFKNWLKLQGLPSRGVYAAPLAAVILLGMYVLVAFIWRHHYEKRTYLVLREHGHDVCLQCGYLLQGLSESTDACPECGTLRAASPPSRAPSESDP